MALRGPTQMGSDFPVSSPTLLRTSINQTDLLFRDGFMRPDETRQVIRYQTGPAIDLVADAVAVPTLSGAGNSGGSTAYSYAAIAHFPLVPGPGLAASPLGLSSTVVVNQRTIAGYLNAEAGVNPRGAAPGSVQAPLWDDRRTRRYGLPPCPTVTTLSAAYTPTAATITIGGSVHTGDLITLNVGGTVVTYTLVAGDSTTTLVATHLTSAITTAAPPNIVATSSGAIITITGAGIPFSLSAVVSGTSNTITATTSGATSEPNTITATIGGTFTAGNVLTVTVNGTAIAYTVLSGDTNNAGAAASFATAITAGGVAGVSATNAAAVITIIGPIATITRTNPANMTITLGTLGGPFTLTEPSGVRPGSWLNVASGPTTVKVLQAVQTVLVPFIPVLPNAATGTLAATTYGPGAQQIAVEFGGYIAVGDALLIGNVGAANRETVTVTAVADPAAGAGLAAQFTFTATLVNSHAMNEAVMRAAIRTNSQTGQASAAAVVGIVGQTTAGNATLTATNKITVTAPAAGTLTGVLFDLVKVSPTTGAVLGAVALGVAAAAAADDVGNINTTTTTAIAAGSIGAIVGMTSATGMFVGQVLTIAGASPATVMLISGLNVTVSFTTATTALISSGATVTGSNLIPYTPNIHSEVGNDSVGAVYQANIDTLAVSR